MLVFVLALAAYANSIGNGFAYDDNEIVLRNRAVTEGDVISAVSRPYWPTSAPGAGLYRPLTSGGFAVQWVLFDGWPAGFHAVNVLGHGLVTLLVFFLLLTLLGAGAAVIGGALFAVHPLHTETVANVVGWGEISCALFFLAACLLYLRGREWGPGGRSARLLGIGLACFLSLGSKEMGVTLPGVLLLLEAFRDHPKRFLRRVWDEVPVYLLLTVVLGGYVLSRWLVLGSVLGEVPAPELRGLGPAGRILTALQLWPEYLRLLLFPFDLAADYAPGVLMPTGVPTPEAVAGATILAGLVLLAVVLHDRSAGASLGIGWLLITILPVSQMLFPAGTLLAERTLYLPSVSLCLVAGALAEPVSRLGSRARRAIVAGAVLVLLAFLVRTVTRNPSWLSTYTVLDTLAREHPESYLALRTRAAGLIRVGEMEEGMEAYEAALALAPRNYGLLVEVAAYHGRRREWALAEPILRRALEVAPGRVAAYRHMASQYLLQGRTREGRAVALEGLRTSGPDGELWSLVSESYVAGGDLEAAARACGAALAQKPESAKDWRRLGEILEALGDGEGAKRAHHRAAQLEAGHGVKTP